MKYTLIVNPNAGKKRGSRTAGEAVTAFAGHNIESELLFSEKAGEAVRLARNLDLSATDAVIAVGGDGTLFEVINGLMSNRTEFKLPLGQIPVGTGNSFLRDLDIIDRDDAIKAIVAGNTRKVDLVRFSESGKTMYFINLLGAGFVSNVARRANRYKRFGPLSYIIGVFQEVAVMKPANVILGIDGEEVMREALFVEICNSRYTGGDMMMAPDARIDDGLLDVVMLNKITRRKLISIFPQIFRGTHTQTEVVEVFRGKKVILRADRHLHLTPDGEIFGTTPVTAEILPGRLRMFG
ncbi:MAG: diacylglycerol kinase family lipid kinase [Spirochaetales bacterium]|nr:diacylglycerol kinase family lipid kinase [Spirochaetales bacterium]